MTLLERGIVLNNWQQEHFEIEPTRIAAYHRLGREIGKTFLSYVMVLENALKDPESLVLVDPNIDPDNTTKRLKDNWALGLHIFASKYYPEVVITYSRYKSTIVITLPAKRSKKVQLLNVIKDFV